MEEGKKVCCFFGHRKISDTEQLRERLYKIIEDLIICNKVSIFLFGSKSEFDRLCREVVGKLKEKYPHLHRIYIRAEFQHISDDYEKYLLQTCDETFYSERAIGSGKAVYIERNCDMIDQSDFCVVYYKEDYAPPKRKSSRHDLFDYQPKSGTKTAYEYAKRKKKRIINIVEQ